MNMKIAYTIGRHFALQPIVPDNLQQYCALGNNKNWFLQKLYIWI